MPISLRHAYPFELRSRGIGMAPDGVRSETRFMFGPDNLAMREWVYSLVDPADVNSVLDLGCGHGEDRRRLGERLPAATRLVGFDSSEKAIAGAKEVAPAGNKYEFLVHDASQGMPFGDGEFDVIYSLNFLECVPNRTAVIREMHRVLRAGGQVVCGHFDWDTQVFDGIDKAVIRKIVLAYSDWQQPWMTAVDGWMGRRLWREFQSAGGFEGKIEAYVLVNTEYSEPYFGLKMACGAYGLWRQKIITDEEIGSFFTGLNDMAARDEYFFSINLYVYTGRKA